MQPSEIIKESEALMKKAVDATEHDFQKIRTGRANPAVLEDINVDYYGVPTPVNQVGNVSIPEPRQLMITPYDKNHLSLIEKAIQASDLGVNPNNDGTNIRLIFPPMTEERRKELVKQVHARGEEGCVSVRHARRHALDLLGEAEDNKEIGEDEKKRYEKQIEDLTHTYVDKTHAVQAKKEQELMEI